MYSIVTTQTVLNDLIRNSASWNAIIRNTKDFVVKINKDFRQNSDDPLFLLSQAGAHIKDGGEYIDGINLHSNTVLDYPNSIFLLDIETRLANKIQSDFGVQCYGCKDDTIPEPSVCKKGWSITTLNIRRRNWRNLLSKHETGSNAIIIIDRYLFSSESGESIQDSYDNLEDILSSVIPQKLDPSIDYHVLIIFDFEAVKHRDAERISEISSKLNKIKKKLDRPFHVVIELFSMSSSSYKYDETHDRKVITNYYSVSATHKVKAFRAELPLCRQDIYLKYIFSEGLENDLSDIPLESQTADLCFIQEAISFAENNWGNTYLYARNGQEMEHPTFVNRLIKNK
jgi:hypothetical protein